MLVKKLPLMVLLLASGRLADRLVWVRKLLPSCNSQLKQDENILFFLRMESGDKAGSCWVPAYIGIVYIHAISKCVKQVFMWFQMNGLLFSIIRMSCRNITFFFIFFRDRYVKQFTNRNQVE